jgi:3-hydroxyacyl-CoA dehydrogenase
MQRDGEIAVVTVDNPPVSSLKHEVRAGILDAFTRVNDDASVKVIVLAAAGRTFIAGAVIMEFGKPPTSPGLVDVIAAIDEIKKPTIAAIYGGPLSGGLEMTLDTTLQPAAYLNTLADEGRGFASLAETEKKSA